MHKDLCNEGFDNHKKQYTDQQGSLRDKWKARAKHSSANKGSGELNHNRHFTLNGLHMQAPQCE